MNERAKTFLLEWFQMAHKSLAGHPDYLVLNVNFINFVTRHKRMYFRRLPLCEIYSTTKYLPQSPKDLKIGTNSLPFSVRLYSTRGGVSGKEVRIIKPSSVISDKCEVSTLREISGIT
jgi:hypothetical protein